MQSALPSVPSEELPISTFLSVANQIPKCCIILNYFVRMTRKMTLVWRKRRNLLSEQSHLCWKCKVDSHYGRLSGVKLSLCIEK